MVHYGQNYKLNLANSVCTILLL